MVRCVLIVTWSDMIDTFNAVIDPLQIRDIFYCGKSKKILAFVSINKVFLLYVQI